MGKSRVASLVLIGMLFASGAEARWFSRNHYDNDGVKYTWVESLYYNWIGLDEYGRYLEDHEDLGGHTVAKHVAKSFGELRGRCSEVEAKNRYKDNFKITYTTFNQAKWSTRKLIKANREVINDFKASVKNGILINAKYVVNVQRKYKYSNIYTGSSYRRYYLYLNGRGINCNLNFLNKVEHKIDYSSGRPVYETIYKDQYTRLSNATAILKKKDGKWYILTSYPSIH